jgi:hypothetical protein
MVRVDLAVMFGLTSSAGVFGSIADMLVAIYKAAGFGPLKKWVDDFLVIRLPHMTWTEEDFINLTGAFGVPWSWDKLRRFAILQRYIGFDWDLEAKSVSLPTEKLSAILQLVKDWQVEGARFTQSESQSLHGKLVHVSSIFRLIRPFIRSVSWFSTNFQSPRAKLHPRPAVVKDLSWIEMLLQLCPNTLPLAVPDPIDINWWGDASSSFGIGVVVGTHFAVWKWAEVVEVGPKKRFDIGWAEAVAVELGFRLALELGLVSEKPGSHFLVRSDNSGVVAVVNKGRSRSLETNRILKHIYVLQAKAQVFLKTEYVETRRNISDALSRGDIPGFLAGFPSAQSFSNLSLPDHLADKLIPVPWFSQ